jgi:hypothetical protein
VKKEEEESVRTQEQEKKCKGIFGKDGWEEEM